MPLPSHLRPRPAGRVDPSREFTGEHWRIQVLTESLLRVEWSPSGTFEDRPTQVVTSRSFDESGGTPPPRVDASWVHHPGGAVLVVRTPHVTLTYDGGPFTAQGLSATVTREEHWGGTWRWGQGDAGTDIFQRNLGGTARTLDTVDGRTDLEPGIMDGRGIAALADDTPAIGPDGWVRPREVGSRDVYVFAHGLDFRGAIADFHRLTGPQPVIPRWALGNWWSRYHAYTAEEYLHLLDEFAAHDVPLAVAVLDMDWHLVDLPRGLGSGWTGFTWNRALFPDPEGFAREVHARGLALSLNLHPADGVRAHEEAYDRVARRMGTDPATGAPVPFDPADPECLATYLEDVLHPLEEGGVDFWWIDWQQGTITRVPGLDPLWVLNHAQFLDSAHRHGGRGLVLSRYAGPGSHRYPVGFSGDTVVSWASLAFQPEFTATASNIGYGWWSHDIGGHMFGTFDAELQVRWVQFGVFSPVLRLHSTAGEFSRKEPWTLPPRERDVVEGYLRLRHRLVPYLHTEQVWGHTALQPLVQPMYWEDPHRRGAWEVPNQYMFGRSLTVAPVTVPVDRATGLAATPVWLPEGAWVDLLTGLAYEGGRRLRMHRDLDGLPVLARRGTVVPLAGTGRPGEAAPGTDLPDALEVLVVAGADGEYTLVEDDGVEGGSAVRTRLAWDQSTLTLTIGACEGDASLLPARRRWRVTVLGAGGSGVSTTAVPSGVAPGASAVRVEGTTRTDVVTDTARGALSVDLDPVAPTTRVVVGLDGAALPVGGGLTGRIHSLLARAEVANAVREGLWATLAGADAGTAAAALYATDVPESLRSALVELFGAQPG